jgi:hypothetical protein
MDYYGSLQSMDFFLGASEEQFTYHKTNAVGRERIQCISIDNDLLWLSSEAGIKKYNRKTGI